jgi:drug/metabolite transporter (DMT)-like permease
MKILERYSYQVLLFGASILGFAAIFVRLAQAEAAPESIGFFRMLLALPFAWALWFFDRDRLPIVLFSKATGLAFLSGVFFAGDLVFWHRSLALTSAANSTFMVGLAPLWVTLIAVALGDRPRRVFWFGLLCALSGAAGLSLASGKSEGISFGEGEILALVASLSYAGCALSLSRARRVLTAKAGLLFMVIGALVSFVILVPIAGGGIGPYQASTWMALVGLGVLVQIGGWFLISSSMGKLPAGQASLGLMMQPISTFLLAIAILGELPGPLEVGASALILFGLWLGSPKS